MPRLSIDVTPEQHRAIKTDALLRDKTIKQLLLEPYLEKATKQHVEDRPVQLPNGDWSGEDIDDWAGLEAVLADRLQEVARGEFVEFNPKEIMARAMARHDAKQKAK